VRERLRLHRHSAGAAPSGTALIMEVKREQGGGGF
jgi:hypothetical protein